MLRYMNKNRQSGEIRAWMLRRGVKVRDVAERIGINRSTVSQCIHGYNNNRRTLRGLLALGCPVRFLALPDDMKSREAA